MGISRKNAKGPSPQRFFLFFKTFAIFVFFVSLRETSNDYGFLNRKSKPAARTGYDLSTDFADDTDFIF